VSDKINLEQLPQEDLFGPGNLGCKGCGAAIAGRQAMKILGERTMITIPASCMATLGANNRRTTWKIPFYHTLFECAPAVSSGIRAALEMQGIKDVKVVSWGGDAGSADIGFQSLSGAAERNEDIFHVCYDNEMYMNTGGQAGSQTPQTALTSNSFLGKPTNKKNMLSIMEAHDIGYVASAAIAFPLDFMAKLKKATARKGFSYIHVLAPCFRGWGISSDQTVEFARRAVQSGLWELYEVEDGRRKRTVEPQLIPVKDYILPQKRFSKISAEEIIRLQQQVDDYYGKVGK
jgi:pyruvate ferredoxin oxidoreductase beta subunit